LSSGAGRSNPPPLTTRAPVTGWFTGGVDREARRSGGWFGAGVEFAQGFGLLAGGDLFGQQPSGPRAVRQSPHTVPARHVDASKPGAQASCS